MQKSKLLKIVMGIVVILVFLVSCEPPQPKPRGYFRIEFPEKEYASYTNDEFPFQFTYAKNVSEVKIIGLDKDSLWMNIVYPRYNAYIYCTYRVLHNNFQFISEDSRRLVYKPHTAKADAITEQLYLNDDKRVYGVMYELKGNTASNIQFVMSDSVKHFFRGAFYVNENPNKDSIAPVVDYIREDIVQLIESLEWK
ncbi:MAG: gliding motility lipoprotein GldD [Paludibacteraceae bacterium]|nr:gliding motility lipoprotein GldD [Paludibacteraceae bacterium]MBO7635332.1 gliding motility lipoprotein GldD [Paludibacteraceae bacterium]